MRIENPVFYCQLDYEGVPYPSPKTGFGNLADNGCGPISLSMLVENMLKTPFSPQQAAVFALQNFARADVGTDYYILAAAACRKFRLWMTVTEDGGEAQRFLKEGRGMAVANTYGDRPGHIGVFSDGGHYILLTGAEGDKVMVLDPMYRPGRFDIPGRAGKVEMRGPLAVADFDIVRADCWHRPYFLFRRMEEN